MGQWTPLPRSGNWALVFHGIRILPPHVDRSRGQVRAGVVYTSRTSCIWVKSFGRGMIRLHSSTTEFVQWILIVYGLPIRMATQGRFLVFYLLFLECCFPPRHLNMASRACVARDALSSGGGVFFAYFSAVFICLNCCYSLCDGLCFLPVAWLPENGLY